MVYTQTHTYIQNDILSKYTDIGDRSKDTIRQERGGETQMPAKARVLKSTKHLSPSGSGQQMCLFSLGAGSDESCSPVQESRAEA